MVPNHVEVYVYIPGPAHGVPPVVMVRVCIRLHTASLQAPDRYRSNWCVADICSDLSAAHVVTDHSMAHELARQHAQFGIV